jgi:hypothetical protein
MKQEGKAMNARKTSAGRAAVSFAAALFCLAAAAVLPAQETSPAKNDTQVKKESTDKKRAFTDSDLEKYKGKGNISQSTLGGKAKPGSDGKTGAAAKKPSSPFDSLFKPGLGQKEEPLKAETVTACEEREKASRDCAPYQERWIGLNKSLNKARTVSERNKILDQIRALEKEMEPAMTARHKAEQRCQQCMDRASQAGILTSQADAQYKSAAKDQASVANDGR